mgnify:CR=1 FL=1
MGGTDAGLHPHRARPRAAADAVARPARARALELDGAARRRGQRGLRTQRELHRLGAARRAPRERNRVERHVVHREVAHLEGGREHRALERAAFGDALVIIEAGTLTPRSKLRSAFEASKQAAAIPCYSDEGQGLRNIVLETLGQSQIRVSPDAMSYLLENLGSDRMVSRSELEKLRLYMGEETEVTIADAIACVGDSSSMALDDIAFSAASGKIERLTHLLDRGRREGTAAISILRGVGRHFERLHLVSGTIDWKFI